ncbi:MAG TPA: hypothetical protein VIJ84_02890 [Gaiellaceae bacterium]
MTSRAELLLFLGLPPQAGADEIELVYLERRADAEKRLRQGDTRARFEIERLDGVFRRLDAMDAEEEEGVTAPVAASVRKPSLLRPAGSGREARGSVALGIAACLVVLWAFFVYRSSLTGGSLNILNLLQSPVYLLVFLLALGAEALSYMSHKDESRARYLARQGLESPDELESQVSYARVGRWLGRIAVALALLLAILLATSLLHLLEHKAS